MKNIFLCLTIFLSFCHKKDKKPLEIEQQIFQDSFQYQKEHKLTSNLLLSKDIYGCGCLIYLSERDIQFGKYIGAYNYSNSAFIGLDGMTIDIQFTDYNEKKKAYNYANKIFTLQIKETSMEYTGVESSHIRAKLTLAQNGKIIIQKYVVIVCTC